MSARPNSMSSRRVVAFIMKPTKQYQDQSTSFGKHRKSFPLHEHQSADSCHGVTESLAPCHLFIPSFVARNGRRRPGGGTSAAPQLRERLFLVTLGSGSHRRRPARGRRTAFVAELLAGDRRRRARCIALRPTAPT